MLKIIRSDHALVGRMCDTTPSSMVGATSMPNNRAKHSLVRRFDRLHWGDVSLDVLLSWQ